jgi:uncharacterized membrane protein YhaH (DUF805 family)
MVKIVFPHRIARLSYLLRIPCFVFVNIVLAFLFAKIAHLAPVSSASPVLGHGSGTTPDIDEIKAELPILLFLAFCYLAYFLPFIAAPRLRDIGLNPWVCLVYLIKPIAPFIALIALFFPSDSYTKWQKNRS